MATYKLPKLPDALRDVIEEVTTTTCKTVSDIPLTEWAQKYVVLAGDHGAHGKFSIDGSNYLIEPMNAMQSWDTKQVIILKAIQTFGTGLGELYLQWCVDNRPFPTLWVCQTEVMAKKQMNTRIKPSILLNDALTGYMPTDQRKVKGTGIEFPHMSFSICGPSENNLQSGTKGCLIVDELAFYENDNLLQEAKARVKYFEDKGMSKVIIISQAGHHDGELNKEWLDSSQEDWAVPCPECKKHFVPYITQFSCGGRKWNDPDLGLKDPSTEKYNIGKLEKLLTLDCPHCGHHMQDTPQLKKYWNDHGKYIVGNPDHLKGHRGFRWNCIHKRSWIQLIQQFIHVCRCRKNGDSEPFRKFFAKEMARPISPEEFFIGSRQVKSDVPYDKSGWPDEHLRIFTIDVQEHHFVGLIRPYAKDGRSHQIWCGRMMTIQDVLDKQKEYNIPFIERYGQRTYLVGWDTGNPMRIREVYQYIVAYNHIGVKGETSRHGYYNSYWDKKLNRKIETFRLWKKSITGGDPHVGTPLQGKTKKAELYLIATDISKKILATLRDGKGSEWLCLPMTEPFMEEYNKSMYSEYSKEEIRSGKRMLVWKKVSADSCNDYWDCENYNLVLATMAGIKIRELDEMPTNEFIHNTTEPEKQESGTQQ
jgi:hypothetical protein